MNKSPGCAWRESVQTRVIVAVDEPLNSSPPQPSATYVKERGSTSLQCKCQARVTSIADKTSAAARNNPASKPSK